MMDITVNKLLRRKKSVQNHQIMSDLVASTLKNQQAKASRENPCIHFSGKESSPGLSCCAVKVGEKRKRTESQDVFVNLGNRRVSGDIGEESGSGKQLHEADLCKETLLNGQLYRKQDAQLGAAAGISQNLEADQNSVFCDTSLEVAVQPNTFECAGLKFNNFDKLAEGRNKLCSWPDLGSLWYSGWDA